MKQRLQHFMSGRYGADEFARFLSVLALAAFLISLFTGGGLLYWIGIGLLCYSWFRMLSRNTARRYQENLVYRQISQSFSASVQRRFGALQRRFAQRKQYRFFHCPHCRQELRVPRGKGKIEVTCPKCHTNFLGKSWGATLP